MRVTKAQIKADIRALLDTLQPWGITKPSQLVRLQREKSDPNFPSDGYIRLMLNERDEPQPSERFCNWFYALAEFIYEGLARDTDTVALLARSLGIGATPEYVRHVRFVVMPDHAAIEDYDLLAASDQEDLVLALIPKRLRRFCHWDECGRAFPGAPQENYCCAAHRKAARNARRRQQRQSAKSPPALERAA